MRLDERKKGVAILSDFCCDYPFGYVRNGRVVITLTHKGEPHMLALTPDELRLLAAKAEDCAKLEAREG